MHAATPWSAPAVILGFGVGVRQKCGECESNAFTMGPLTNSILLRNTATHRPREGAAPNDEIQWGVVNVMKGALVLPLQIQDFSAEAILKTSARSVGTFLRDALRNMVVGRASLATHV